MKVTERLVVEIIQNDLKTAIRFHSKRPKFMKKDAKNPITVSRVGPRWPTLDKKAFDTIDHSLLIKKLGHYGVRGIASNWLKSYLLNRKQFVNFNGIKSELQDVICGVPQGSILGPKLFILYINDMCNITKVMDLIIFADDTNIFCTADNIKDLCKLIEN